MILIYRLIRSGIDPCIGSFLRDLREVNAAQKLSEYLEKTPDSEKDTVHIFINAIVELTEGNPEAQRCDFVVVICMRNRSNRHTISFVTATKSLRASPKQFRSILEHFTPIGSICCPTRDATSTHFTTDFAKHRAFHEWADDKEFKTLLVDNSSSSLYKDDRLSKNPSISQTMELIRYGKTSL